MVCRVAAVFPCVHVLLALSLRKTSSFCSLDVFRWIHLFSTIFTHFDFLKFPSVFVRVFFELPLAKSSIICPLCVLMCSAIFYVFCSPLYFANSGGGGDGGGEIIFGFSNESPELLPGRSQPKYHFVTPSEDRNKYVRDQLRHNHLKRAGRIIIKLD